MDILQKINALPQRVRRLRREKAKGATITKMDSLVLMVTLTESIMNEKLCEWQPDFDFINGCRKIQLGYEQDHSRNRILGNISRKRELRRATHWSL